MAHVIVFPDHAESRRAFSFLQGSSFVIQTLEAPEFCRGLVAPALFVTSRVNELVNTLEEQGIQTSGDIEFHPFRREIPQASAPDPIWLELTGGIRLSHVRNSLTDAHRLRFDVRFEKSIAPLIPVMARLIRGGTFRPEAPVLTFEEQYRLIVITGSSVVVSRCDDLLDFWIILRTAVDLLAQAWDLRSSLDPETKPRRGIGAMEVFRRLPASDCGQCGSRSCMEFATALTTGKAKLTSCRPLFHAEESVRRESLVWFLRVIGLLEGPV
jgi:ArsR family metal-binding transcriptional regulator